MPLLQVFSQGFIISRDGARKGLNANKNTNIMPSINVDPKTKAWIQLISLAVGTGSAITGTTYAGGCKLWVAILAGIGSAGSAVFHAVSDSPNDK